jgi:hypothetical protein
MEEVLREPVELTEFELDAVAGGSPFSNNAVTVAGHPAPSWTHRRGFAAIVCNGVVVAVVGNTGISKA